MIAHCPECHASLTVDESRLGPQGSKVRCGGCKHVFTVTRPPPPAPRADTDSDKTVMYKADAPLPAGSSAAAVEPKRPVTKPNKVLEVDFSSEKTSMVDAATLAKLASPHNADTAVGRNPAPAAAKPGGTYKPAATAKSAAPPPSSAPPPGPKSAPPARPPSSKAVPALARPDNAARALALEVAPEDRTAVGVVPARTQAAASLPRTQRQARLWALAAGVVLSLGFAVYITGESFYRALAVRLALLPAVRLDTNPAFPNVRLDSVRSLLYPTAEGHQVLLVTGAATVTAPQTGVDVVVEFQDASGQSLAKHALPLGLAVDFEEALGRIDDGAWPELVLEARQRDPVPLLSPGAPTAFMLVVAHPPQPLTRYSQRISLGRTGPLPVAAPAAAGTPAAVPVPPKPETVVDAAPAEKHPVKVVKPAKKTHRHTGRRAVDEP